MKVARVYADAQGETHFADHDIALRDAGHDTIGKGHRTRNVEPRERRSIFIILEPQGSLP